MLYLSGLLISLKGYSVASDSAVLGAIGVSVLFSRCLFQQLTPITLSILVTKINSMFSFCIYRGSHKNNRYQKKI